jgi:hypothetical protein
MRLALLCAPLLLAACAAAQTVEGTIVNTATDRGIGEVKVALVSTSRDHEPYTSTTDAAGHFVIENVKPGEYAPYYGPPCCFILHDVGRRFQVTAAGSTQLEARMTPMPRISGRIVNKNGEGVANAQVEAIGQASPPARTDASGKFELRLPPETWILVARPPNGLEPPVPEPDTGQPLVWAETFYPGVARLDSASEIVLRSGSELSGIEMKLLALPAHRVRGLVLNPDRTPAPKLAITLGEGHALRKPGATDKPVVAATESSPDGTFEFPRVMDGEWLLAAEMQTGGGKLRITQWVDMAGHDLEEIKLRLALPFTVRGQVAIETPQGVRAPDPLPVYLVPHTRPVRSDTSVSNWMHWPLYHFELPLPRNGPDTALMNEQIEVITTSQMGEEGAAIARPRADGSFSFENIYAGSYRIASMTPPPPYYMAAIRVGETELTTAEVEVSSGAIPITVVYKTDGGSVRGTAENCATGVVLLIPQNPALQSRGFLRYAPCDSSDRYEITTVRPGAYYALAFAGIKRPLKLDEVLINQATKITIRATETTTADLPAIPVY